MRESTSDDAVARFAQQHALASAAQVKSAREFQASCAREGKPTTLADALVSLGIITPAQREAVEQRLREQPSGSIQHLGHYRLVKKLGEGGMGAVYLAQDTLSDLPVALKVLSRKRTGDPSFLTRFQREADAAGRLHHANIVRAFAFGEEKGWHYYVMEYCEGETLDKRLKRDGWISTDEATDIIVQTARGLQYAHAMGIIHRDIKPSNLFLTPGGIVKILDLGLSKNVESEDAPSVTQPGMTVGTPHYMSPEQVRGDREVDARSDIYSLGATYYHLVSGDTPFHGSSAFEVVTKHLSEQLPDPRDLREDIPEGVVRVIRRMMAKRSEHRYPDCGALLEDLGRVAAGLEPNSGELEAALSSVAMPLKPVRRRTQMLKGTRQAGTGRRPTNRLAVYAVLGGIAVAVPVLGTMMIWSGRGAAPRADGGPKDEVRTAPAVQGPSDPARPSGAVSTANAKPASGSPAAGGRPAPPPVAPAAQQMPGRPAEPEPPRLPPSLVPVLAALEAEVRGIVEGGELQKAIDRAESGRRQHGETAWGQAIDRLTREIRDAAEWRYARLKPPALEAKRLRIAEEIKGYRDTVARWGIPKYVADLESALALIDSHFLVWWKLDEPEGAVASDASGNDRHGALHGAPAWRPAGGRIGGALEFNGTNDYLAVARVVQDDFTIAFWLKTSQPGGPDGWGGGVGLVSGVSDGRGGDFGTSLIEGKFGFGLRVAKEVTVTSRKVVSDWAWHHVAAIRDGQSGEMKVYVDGVLEGQRMGETGALLIPTRLTVGCQQTEKNFYRGLLDDLRIYDRVLSTSEIRSLHDAAGTAGAPAR